ncbi:unnamed protein product [Haemonchus placei]|uniref:Uncharacterized protein n=1 Tax=Haemonchus placei TaxID=6290 RepID=A0A3P7YGG4_HAEPC|nr:unnamed protein product [Haemonchus placei]
MQYLTEAIGVQLMGKVKAQDRRPRKTGSETSVAL